MRTAAIIPLFNKQHSIARTLRSVLHQSVPVDEVIVVNDGSADESERAARSVSDPRIRVVTTRNTGESATRNYGVSLASGSDVILLLDADDEWCPRYVETILRLLRQFPQASAAATGYQFQHRGGTTSMPSFCAKTAPGEGTILSNYFQLSLIAPPLTSSSVGIYRSVYNELGGFSQEQRRGQDLAFWAALALKAKVAFDPAVLATYHLDGENRICEAVFVEREPAVCKILLDHMASGTIDANLAADLAAYYDWHLFDAARQNLIAGRPALARRLLNAGPWTPGRRDLWIAYLLLSALPPSAFRFLYRGVRPRLRAFRRLAQASRRKGK